MEVNKRQHGDGKTKPEVGDKVGVTYVGTFPDGVEYQGVDYSGKVFDTTATINAGKGKPKLDKPLTFTVGENKAIRGWEECVRTMTLGESCELTVGPKWAYRKGGILDEDKGVYIVPPNATLFFKLRLVQVGEKLAE